MNSEIHRSFARLVAVLLLKMGGTPAALTVHSGPSVAILKSGAGRLELDLANLALQQTAGSASKVLKAQKQWPSIPLLLSTLPDGSEVACINCDPHLFIAWVADKTVGLSHLAPGCGSTNSSLPLGGIEDSTGKHPNAPNYGKWASKDTGSLLSMVMNIASTNELPAATAMPCGVTATSLQHSDVETLKPRLHKLWAERRLVVGAGMNPLHQRMDFADILVSLARNSPLLTPPDCGQHNAPHCGTLLSGLRPAASTQELREALSATFGDEFLKANEFDQRLDTAEQRNRVQTLLSALKYSFHFYRQGCLFSQNSGSEKCTQQTTELVGQIACSPEEDRVSDDCVYAELRRCNSCGSARFFEYARFHGPLALYATKDNRDWVMGQCEEFSRAGYALLASLGYQARYVLDFTDHVWIEVRLRQGNTFSWVHADPSEGVLDSPLMYEQGWGKRLTMIFAFTPWSVEHVTATYTGDYQATVFRRGIPEETLQEVIKEANDRLKYELPMDSWGYTSRTSSKNRTLEEVYLWSHFEAH